MEKSYYQFEALFTPQKEGGYTVEVPGLPGCISEGDNLEEAKNHIKESIELYLETLQDRKIPIPSLDDELIRMDLRVQRPDSKNLTNA